MPGNDKETLNKIHEAAEKEFLEKGFKNASLRNIVKKVGVTTGAFYGYYKSKEELFEALVGPVVEHIWQYYNEKLIEFTAMTPEKQKELMSNYEMDYSTELMIYAYDNFDTMKLLLISAGGTRYENFLHELVEKEIESTHSFMKCMEKMGMKVAEFNPYFEHTITSGMFNSLFELIVHDVPVEEALECSKEICKFYQAGWSACMGLK